MAAPDAKAKLLDNVQPLKDLNYAVVKARKNIHATTLEIEAQQQASINKLHTSFKELQNILEQREQELVEVATIAQEKLQKISQ